MERNVFWSGEDNPGLEHLRLVQEQGRIIANGLIIGLDQNIPFRASYRIHCDAFWRVREVDIALLDGSGQGRQELHLRADGAGHWTTAAGEPMPLLDGCLDVDISATPFTNTIAIRRSGLVVTASVDLTVTYVKVPELQVKPAKQRYTCLELSSDGGLYRYEGLLTHFKAELKVDRDGLVIDYPELFKRVWVDG